MKWTINKLILICPSKLDAGTPLGALGSHHGLEDFTDVDLPCFQDSSPVSLCQLSLMWRRTVAEYQDMSCPVSTLCSVLPVTVSHQQAVITIRLYNRIIVIQ